MKKAGLLVLALGLWTGLALLPAFAQQVTTASLPVYAPVDPSLNLDIIIRSVDPTPDGTPSYDPWDPAHSREVFRDVADPSTGGRTHSGSGMNFGTLTFANTQADNNHVWRSSVYFAAFLYASTSGRPYQITQQCNPPANGTANFNNSFIMTPDYESGDHFLDSPPQGGLLTGESTGPSGLAAQRDLIFKSTNAGMTKIVRCYYGLATGKNDPAGAPLGADQPAGHYQGSVTFTVTLI